MVLDSDKNLKPIDVEDGPRQASFEVATADDILSLQDVDPALNAKMHIVNNVRSAQII